MSVAVHAFTTVPIREDLRANRQSGDIILDADGEFDLQFLSVFRQVPRQSRTFAGVLMFMAIVTPNCSKNQRTFLNLAFSCFDYCSSRCTRDLLNKIPFKIWKIPTGRATNFKLNVTIKHCQKILPPCTLAPV